MDQVTQTAVATVESLLPTILASAGAAAAVGSASNPAVASALALAPVAIQAIQLAQQFVNAGAMTQDQLAALFVTIGANLQNAHNQWAAMNQASTAQPTIIPAA
jgi:hypothetical protein